MSIVKKIKYKIPKGIRESVENYWYGKSIEEVDLVFDFFKKENKKGLMIDVGAHAGSAFVPFAKKDWAVYAFEPDKRNHEKLSKVIGKYKNVQLDNRAVSDQDNLEVPFYSSDVSTGISGLSNFHPSHKKVDSVKTVTLKTFCNDNKIEDISFLKIDTEGYDLFVLKGFDWDNHEHPKVIVTEFEDNKTKPLGYSFYDQASFLQQHNYKLISSEWFPIVAYGKRHLWKRFVTDYKQITDPNAWGNIIAVKEEWFEKLLQVASRYGKID